ncbi:MAG: GFA family protein [Paracoccaceae bacterium]
MDNIGRCLCGAVSFEIKDMNPKFGACHCKMCQRWAGSALLSLTIPKETITFQGLEHVKRRQTSDWAERAWCDACGAGLWYRVTAKGPEQGTYHMPIGLLDDTSGLTMVREIFIDEKSGAFSFDGARKMMTGAEVFAQYAPADKET